MSKKIKFGSLILLAMPLTVQANFSTNKDVSISKYGENPKLRIRAGESGRYSTRKNGRIVEASNGSYKAYLTGPSKVSRGETPRYRLTEVFHEDESYKVVSHEIESRRRRRSISCKPREGIKKIVPSSLWQSGFHCLYASPGTCRTFARRLKVATIFQKDLKQCLNLVRQVEEILPYDVDKYEKFSARAAMRTEEAINEGFDLDFQLRTDWALKGKRKENAAAALTVMGDLDRLFRLCEKHYPGSMAEAKARGSGRSQEQPSGQ